MASAASEAGRLPHSQTERTATARPVQNYRHFSSDYEDSTHHLRLQFLSDTGIATSRPVAAAIAVLGWGGARG